MRQDRQPVPAAPDYQPGLTDDATRVIHQRPLTPGIAPSSALSVMGVAGMKAVTIIWRRFRGRGE